MINYLSIEAELMGLLAERASLSPVNYTGKNVSEGRDAGSYRKKSESEVAQSCPILCDPMDCNLLGSSMGFSRQEY